MGHGGDTQVTVFIKVSLMIWAMEVYVDTQVIVSKLV